jgi:hypothetical protein
MPATEQRYFMQFGPDHAYAIWDEMDKMVVFTSTSQSEAITKAQQLNQYRPIDGDPRTYRKQTSAARTYTHERRPRRNIP